MNDRQAETIAVAVTAVTGLDSFDVQHRMMGRDVGEVADMWRSTIRTLLT